MDGGDQDPGQDRRRHAQPEVVGCERNGVADEGAGQHDALEGDVGHTRALAHDTAKSRQRQWGGGDQGLGAEHGDVAGLDGQLKHWRWPLAP